MYCVDYKEPSLAGGKTAESPLNCGQDISLDGVAYAGAPVSTSPPYGGRSHPIEIVQGRRSQSVEVPRDYCDDYPVLRAAWERAYGPGMVIGHKKHNKLMHALHGNGKKGGGTKKKSQTQKSKSKKPRGSSKKGGGKPQSTYTTAFVAQSKNTTTRRAQTRTTPRGTMFKKSEMIFVVPGAGTGTGFQIHSFNINPGLDIYPWLSKEARGFDKYRIHSWSYEYVPRCPTGTRGYYDMGIDYNVSAGGPTSDTQLSSYEGAAEASSYAPRVLRVNPATAHSSDRFKFIRNQFPGAPLKDYDGGVMYLGVSGQDDDEPIGKIWVHYNIELIASQTYDGKKELPCTSSAFSGFGDTATSAGGTEELADNTWTPILNWAGYVAASSATIRVDYNGMGLAAVYNGVTTRPTIGPGFFMIDYNVQVNFQILLASAAPDLGTTMESCLVVNGTPLTQNGYCFRSMDGRQIKSWLTGKAYIQLDNPAEITIAAKCNEATPLTTFYVAPGNTDLFITRMVGGGVPAEQQPTELKAYASLDSDSTCTPVPVTKCSTREPVCVLSRAQILENKKRAEVLSLEECVRIEQPHCAARVDSEGVISISKASFFKKAFIKHRVSGKCLRDLGHDTLLTVESIDQLHAGFIKLGSDWLFHVVEGAREGFHLVTAENRDYLVREFGEPGATQQKGQKARERFNAMRKKRKTREAKATAAVQADADKPVGVSGPFSAGKGARHPLNVEVTNLKGNLFKCALGTRYRKCTCGEGECHLDGHYRPKAPLNAAERRLLEAKKREAGRKKAEEEKDLSVEQKAAARKNKRATKTLFYCQCNFEDVCGQEHWHNKHDVIDLVRYEANIGHKLPEDHLGHPRNAEAKRLAIWGGVDQADEKAMLDRCSNMFELLSLSEDNESSEEEEDDSDSEDEADALSEPVDTGQTGFQGCGSLVKPACVFPAVNLHLSKVDEAKDVEESMHEQAATRKKLRSTQFNSLLDTAARRTIFLGGRRGKREYSEGEITRALKKNNCLFLVDGATPLTVLGVKLPLGNVGVHSLTGVFQGKKFDSRDNPSFIRMVGGAEGRRYAFLRHTSSITGPNNHDFFTSTRYTAHRPEIEPDPPPLLTIAEQVHILRQPDDEKTTEAKTTPAPSQCTTSASSETPTLTTHTTAEYVALDDADEVVPFYTALPGSPPSGGDFSGRGPEKTSYLDSYAKSNIKAYDNRFKEPKKEPRFDTEEIVLARKAGMIIRDTDLFQSGDAEQAGRIRGMIAYMFNAFCDRDIRHKEREISDGGVPILYNSKAVNTAAFRHWRFWWEDGATQLHDIGSQLEVRHNTMGGMHAHKIGAVFTDVIRDVEKDPYFQSRMKLSPDGTLKSHFVNSIVAAMLQLDVTDYGLESCQALTQFPNIFEQTVNKLANNALILGRVRQGYNGNPSLDFRSGATAREASSTVARKN